MRKFKTLNNRQMTPVKGGGESKVSICIETGDTLYCTPTVGKVVLCITHEQICPNGVVVKCGELSNYSIACMSVTITPKK